MTPLKPNQLNQLVNHNRNLDRIKCLYCERNVLLKHTSIDHRLPRSRGGSDDPRNLQRICMGCNQLKQNKTHGEYRKFIKEMGLSFIRKKAEELISGMYKQVQHKEGAPAKWVYTPKPKKKG